MLVFLADADLLQKTKYNKNNGTVTAHKEEAAVFVGAKQRRRYVRRFPEIAFQWASAPAKLPP